MLWLTWNTRGDDRGHTQLRRLWLEAGQPSRQPQRPPLSKLWVSKAKRYNLVPMPAGTLPYLQVR
eukprot:COSAG01_NODE_2664_length_7291_cov_4.395996_7_plen_65_part_00